MPPPLSTPAATPLASARDMSGKRARHPFDVVLHAPAALRALVRADEIWLTLLGALVGVLAGISVAAMTLCAQGLHEALFGLARGQRLSSAVSLDGIRAVAVLTVGGAAVGGFALLLARYRPRRAIDPIEANALYGGQMSIGDSVALVAHTLLSNGVGASVGLEAGYTQIGAAVASRIGRGFRLRRNDLRVLVGCGAAGAIAAAFDAPLTGAFYAFELVIGTYSLATLAPVVLAAICAVLTNQFIIGQEGGFALLVPSLVAPIDYIAILALGVVCALAGIAIMRAVTLTEDLFRRSGVPAWLRPAIGGLVVGLLALLSPQVLSSGHGALAVGLDAPYPMSQVALLLVLKAIGSAVSIGSGFRGGLFFASLFLGALLGKLFSAVVSLAPSLPLPPPIVCAIVGMSALAVAIVGGPLTMSFLALESTGSLPMTIAVLVASVVSSLTVRRTFGYSFATWRFHLRGEAIRSAVDIGWVRNLTVGKMMRRDVRTVRADTLLTAFRRDFPLGSASQVVAVDSADRYAGIVLLADAHAENGKAERVADLLHFQNNVMLPQMTVKQAVAMFEQTESDALAVIDGPETRLVIGLLTEQHTLRRYSEELERRRRDVTGET